MDFFLLFGMITIGMLIVSFIAYSTTTNRIIKDQERQLERYQRLYRKALNEQRVRNCVPKRYFEGEEK